MKRTFIIALSALFALQTQAQLLKGKVEGVNLKSITIEYSPKGDVMETEYKEIPVKDGVFVFETVLPVETVDVGVLAEGRNALGAHLTKGKTLEMTITEKDGRLVASYKGVGADVSPVVSRMSEAYDIMRYFSLDPSQKKTTEEYLQLLDHEYAAVKPLLKNIKNKQLRYFYTRLNDAKCKEQKARIMSNDIYEKKLNPKDDAEYKALLADVDINDEISRISGLSLTKLTSRLATTRATITLSSRLTRNLQAPRMPTSPRNMRVRLPPGTRHTAEFLHRISPSTRPTANKCN